MRFWCLQIASSLTNFTFYTDTKNCQIIRYVIIEEFFIHQIYWWWRFCPRHPACRNRRTKGPEGPWRAVHVAAQPGWRSGKPNMQPVTPVTSYKSSKWQSALVCCWRHPFGLQYMAISFRWTCVVSCVQVT